MNSVVESLKTRLRESESFHGNNGNELPVKMRPLVLGLEDWQPGDFYRCEQSIRRHISDLGISFNRYRDGRAVRFDWPLDFLPYILTADEWAFLERGLEQRSRLFNQLLKDVYGPRDLVRAGVLPPEILYRAPGFCRPVFTIDEITRSAVMNITLHGCDLVREETTGNFLVFQDKLQSPSGAGYALQNRKVLSRTLGSLFRSYDVRRYYRYFDAYRQIILSHSREVDREPLVVMLSAGPRNETWYEQAYIANYLGITLARGTDLEVRSGRLYLQTLEGRHQVDIILRRLDDDFLDPVELRADSLVGVPGLLEAIRAGHVRVLNPPGAAFLENKALFTFLPALCRFYLGEELVLPQVESLWLGSEDNRKIVAERKDEFVLKKSEKHSGDNHFYGRHITAKKWQELLTRTVAADPGSYTAQKFFEAESVPVFARDRFQRGRMLLRTFTVVNRQEQPLVLPGGLARVTGNPDNPVITNQQGATSKDVWVLDRQPLGPYQELGEENTPLVLASTESVAESSVWLGRYMTRLDFQLRMVHSALQYFRGFGYDNQSLEFFALHFGKQSPEPVDGFPAFWREYFQQKTAFSSPAVHLGGVLANADNLQNYLPHEVNYYLHQFAHSAAESWESEPRVGDEISRIRAIEENLMRIALCLGIFKNKLRWSTPVCFLRIGIELEKADFLARMSLAGLPPSFAGTDFLFFRDIQVHPRGQSLYDLLTDANHPYSIPRLLNRLARYLARLPGSEKREPLFAFMDELKLNTARLSNLTPGASQTREQVMEIFRTLPDLLDRLYLQLQEQYFPVERPLQSSQGGR